jgi:hypothetical protein
MPPSPSRAALRIVIPYILAAGGWIILTGQIWLGLEAAQAVPARQNWLHSMKGLLFVLAKVEAMPEQGTRLSVSLDV